MPTIKEAATEFLAQQARRRHRRLARAEGPRKQRRLQRLRERGYEVFAVNPNADEVEGDRCYHDLGSIPGGVEAVVIGTRPETAEETMRECVELGIGHVWMHRGPGAGSVSGTAADVRPRARHRGDRRRLPVHVRPDRRRRAQGDALRVHPHRERPEEGLSRAQRMSGRAPSRYRPGVGRGKGAYASSRTRSPLLDAGVVPLRERHDRGNELLGRGPRADMRIVQGRRPRRRRRAPSSGAVDEVPLRGAAAPRPRSAEGTRRRARGSPPARSPRGTCTSAGRATAPDVDAHVGKRARDSRRRPTSRSRAVHQRRLARVDDEPAVARRNDAVLGLLESCLFDHDPPLAMLRPGAAQVSGR